MTKHDPDLKEDCKHQAKSDLIIGFAMAHIPFILVLGCFILRVWPSFELSRKIDGRKSELCSAKDTV